MTLLEVSTGCPGCTKDVAKGLVLLNSAGRLLSPEDYSVELTAMGGARMKDYMAQKGLFAFADEKDSLSMRAPFWLRKAFASGLFLFLQVLERKSFFQI